MQPKILEMRTGYLDNNDHLARKLRTRFSNARLLVVHLVSSPGSGKTLLLERTLLLLKQTGYRAAALVGNLTANGDAGGLEATGLPVRHVLATGKSHLDAQLIEQHVDGLRLNELDFLFIENVGDLTHPSATDLGEHVRAVLLSVTEGEDQPLKYPSIFRSSDMVIISKTDLTGTVVYNRVAVRGAIRSIRPDMPVLEVSASTGAGMTEWLRYLLVRRAVVLITGDSWRADVGAAGVAP